MASLPTVDYFLNFTKICSFCKKQSKTFKILLSSYSGSNGQCVLTAEEKKKFCFICPIYCSVNQLDSTQMCNKYTIKLLQNKTLGGTEIEQALIKLIVRIQLIFLFLIIYTTGL